MAAPHDEAAARPVAEHAVLHHGKVFDVVADPQEKHDVSTEHREIADRLRQRYEALLKTAAPAFSEADREPIFHSPAVWGEFPATQPSTGMQKSE